MMKTNRLTTRYAYMSTTQNTQCNNNEDCNVYYVYVYLFKTYARIFLEDYAFVYGTLSLGKRF